jgi:hypothetical protein
MSAFGTTGAKRLQRQKENPRHRSWLRGDTGRDIPFVLNQIPEKLLG